MKIKKKCNETGPYQAKMSETTKSSDDIKDYKISEALILAKPRHISQ